MPAGGAHVTTQFLQSVNKEYDSVFMDNYDRAIGEMDGVAHAKTTIEPYLLEGEMSTFRTISKITEGGPAPMYTRKEGNHKQIDYDEYALAAQITKKMIEDDRFGNLKEIPAGLGRAARTTRDIMFFDLFNSGFVTTVRTTIDSKALFASDHPIIDTYGASTIVVANLLSGEFNYENVQTALDYFENMIDEEGLPAPAGANLILIPPALRFKARELKYSEYNPTNANNTINVLTREDLTYRVVHWFSSSTMWAIMNTKMHDLRFITRRAPNASSWVDGITGNMLYKTDARWIADVVKHRYVAASTGT